MASNQPFADLIGTSRECLAGFNMLSGMPPGPVRDAVADTLRDGYGHLFDTMSAGVAVYEAVDNGEDFIC